MKFTIMTDLGEMESKLKRMRDAALRGIKSSGYVERADKAGIEEMIDKVRKVQFQAFKLRDLLFDVLDQVEEYERIKLMQDKADDTETVEKIIDKHMHALQKELDERGFGEEVRIGQISLREELDRDIFSMFEDLFGEEEI